MKKLAFLIIVLFSTLMLTACSSKQAEAHDSQGNPIWLSKYKGKWVVINYWATWCKPCLTEMPVLENLYKNNQNKLVVIGVSYDNLSANEIEKVRQKYQLTYPMVPNLASKKFSSLEFRVLPLTLIINPEGKWVKTLKGPQTETQLATAMGINPRNG